MKSACNRSKDEESSPTSTLNSLSRTTRPPQPSSTNEEAFMKCIEAIETGDVNIINKTSDKEKKWWIGRYLFWFGPKICTTSRCFISPNRLSMPSPNPSDAQVKHKEDSSQFKCSNLGPLIDIEGHMMVAQFRERVVTIAPA
ncbi:8438_t:CDS:2, partial [Ambispora leptoticha]